jgi:hypothetical protein
MTLQVLESNRSVAIAPPHRTPLGHCPYVDTQAVRLGSSPKRPMQRPLPGHARWFKRAIWRGCPGER